MEAIEPLISTSVTGPLGILHLPRLWLKIILQANGRLPEGYRAGEGGFDGSFFDRFGIDGPAFIAFVTESKPDYLTLEKWVIAHASRLDPENVASWNTYVRTANLAPERASNWRTRFGIVDEKFAHAISLNDLDDWAGIHERLCSPPTP